MLRAIRSVLRFRRIELDHSKRVLARVASVDDLRRIARRRLPRGVFDYVDGGAEDERAARRNVEAYHALELQPNVLCDVSEIDTRTTLLGRPIPAPMVLAAPSLALVLSTPH